MEKIIRIHKDIPAKLVKDTLMLKSMSVFYSMKFLYVGGIIKDIPSRYGEIAGKIGISQSNLRGKVKILIKKGLLKKEGRNLLFAGFDEIGKIFQLKTKKSFKVSHRNAKELEVIIKALSLEVNFEKQRHKVRERIVTEELKRYGKIEAKGIKVKIQKYIRKNIAHYAVKHNKRVSKNSKNPFVHTKVNTDVSISRQGVASMMGKKSKSTGSRLVSKMSSMGLLESDVKRVERVYQKADYNVLKYLNLDSSFFVFKGSLYKRKTNLISLSSFFA